MTEWEGGMGKYLAQGSYAFLKHFQSVRDQIAIVLLKYLHRMVQND